MIAETMQMADDPPKFFNHSNRNAHRLPREQVEEMQLAAFQRRFADLRERLPVLKAAAVEQGIDKIADLDAGSNLVFPDSIYKSYPVSLLEKNRFDQLTKWLGRLTTTDLSKADVRHCDGIDSWLAALEDAAGIQVVNSSGTSGTMTFLPRTRNDYRIVSEIFGMTSRDFNEIESLPDLRKDALNLWFSRFVLTKPHRSKTSSSRTSAFSIRDARARAPLSAPSS